MLDKIMVYLPSYNEEQDIEAIIDLWMEEQAPLRESGYELTVYPIDDASKDRTKELMVQKSKQYGSAVHPLFHEVNKGLGGGVNTALSHFNENSSEKDFAVIMDADNTQKPKYIHSMIRLAAQKNLDCVIASRYQKGSKIYGVSPFRNFMSLGARFYYTIVLGVKNVRDYTCGYRLYGHKIIQKGYETYGKDLVTQRSFSCMMEVLYKLYKIGAAFGEVPFELRYDDKQGESKMNIKSTASSSFKTAWHLRRSIR